MAKYYIDKVILEKFAAFLHGGEANYANAIDAFVAQETEKKALKKALESSKGLENFVTTDDINGTTKLWNTLPTLKGGEWVSEEEIPKIANFISNTLKGNCYELKDLF